MRGSEIVEQLKPLTFADRMRVVYDLIVANEIVRWSYSKVPISDGRRSGHILVSDDYVSLGTPEDFVRVPLDAPTAQRVADHMGALLPTTKIVDLIWLHAAVRLAPTAMVPPQFPYNDSMLSVDRFAIHNGWIEKARAGRTGIVAGHKKDVVVTNRLLKQARRVPIYGWHKSNGVATQPLSLIHEGTYADYSHGVRLIAPRMILDNVWISLEEAMTDPDRAPLIVDVRATVDSGPLTFSTTRWGLVPPPLPAQPKPVQPSKPTPATGTPVVRTSPPPVLAPLDGDVPGIHLVRAKYFRPVETRKIDLVVIHTAEAVEKGTTAEAVAAWTARGCPGADGKERKASWHFMSDPDSIVQSVLIKDVAYSAPGTNHNGIHIEHAGYARQTANEWNDDASQRILQLSAKLAAQLCATYAIPLTFVDAQGLIAGARGITTHAEVTKACRIARDEKLTSSSFFNKEHPDKLLTDHVDPGPNFPMSSYLQQVDDYMDPYDQVA